MEYSTFIRLVKELGFAVVEYDSQIAVDRGNSDYVITVSKKVEYSLNSKYSTFSELTIVQRKALLDLATELASTPISDRGNETWYRLKDVYTESEIAELKLVCSPFGNQWSVLDPLPNRER